MVNFGITISIIMWHLIRQKPLSLANLFQMTQLYVLNWCPLSQISCVKQQPRYYSYILKHIRFELIMYGNFYKVVYVKIYNAKQDIKKKPI